MKKLWDVHLKTGDVITVFAENYDKTKKSYRFVDAGVVDIPQELVAGISLKENNSQNDTK